VVVEPDHLGLTAVGQHDPADDVQLPQCIGWRPQAARIVAIFGHNDGDFSDVGQAEASVNFATYRAEIQ
jgi:hypothetical protein